MSLYNLNKYGNDYYKGRKAQLGFLIDSDGLYECYYCNNLFTKEKHTFDHIIPISKTKRSFDNSFNLVMCCELCNRLKGASETYLQFFNKIKKKYSKHNKYFKERFEGKIFDWRDYSTEIYNEENMRIK